MKKCPTCEKTFEDSMRFCQVDGTPLVDDAPAFDPYATIVAQPRPPIEAVEEEAAAESPAEEPAVEEPSDAPEKVADEPVNQTIGSLPIAEPEDVLDLPANDPLKTVFVSEDEMQAALGGGADTTEDPGMEIPPIEEAPAPEPPSFSVPDVPAPSFGGAPPSPFSASDNASDEAISAPPVFEEPEPAPSAYDAPTEVAPPKESASPEPPPFEEAATMMQPSFNSPFETPDPAPVAEWAPPPAPDASWQNQEIGSNTPFQPPPGGTGSINQTLPIVSLILGIVSICCYISPVTGIAAVITGYLGMKNAKNDPANYGGRGLAMAGMIIGGIMLLVGLAYYIFVILVYAGLLSGALLQGR